PRPLHYLDFLHIQYTTQRQIEANLLAAHGEIAHVAPARLHRFVLDVAQPSAEDREPVTEAHAHATLRSRRSSSASARRAVGSKPITFSGSATKFDSALMS